jgi:hypothetical protein
VAVPLCVVLATEPASEVAHLVVVDHGRSGLAERRGDATSSPARSASDDGNRPRRESESGLQSTRRQLTFGQRASPNARPAHAGRESAQATCSQIR